MKKLLLILLCFPFIFSCNQSKENTNQKTESYEDTSYNDAYITNKTSSQKGFILSEGFIKADEETFLSLLIDANLMVNMSDEERVERIIRLKETTEIYVRENSLDHEENIIINKSELGPSQRLLDMFNSQLEGQAGLLIDGAELILINSGFGKYQDMFDYIFFNTRITIDGYSKRGFQYFISVNNENYHIAINTIEGLDINDVFTEIN